MFMIAPNNSFLFQVPESFIGTRISGKVRDRCLNAFSIQTGEFIRATVFWEVSIYQESSLKK